MKSDCATSDSGRSIHLIITKKSQRIEHQNKFREPLGTLDMNVELTEPEPLIILSTKKMDKNGFSEDFNKLWPEYKENHKIIEKENKSFTDIINFRRNLSKQISKEQWPKTVNLKQVKVKAKDKDKTEKGEILKISEKKNQKKIWNDTQIEVPKEKDSETTSSGSWYWNLKYMNFASYTRLNLCHYRIFQYIDQKVWATWAARGDPKEMIKLQTCQHYFHHYWLKDKVKVHQNGSQMFMFWPCILCDTKSLLNEEISVS